MNIFVCMWFLIISICGNVDTEGKRRDMNTCSKKNQSWKLKSIIFYSNKALVQSEKTLIREVLINSDSESTAELTIKKQFEGYSRYLYQNGTVIRKAISDFGQVPKIVNNKVTQEMEFQSGGLLFAKREIRKRLSSRFICSGTGKSSCKVILIQHLYQVPFTAYIESHSDGYICTSNGWWEKLDDPVLELVTERHL